MVGQNEYLRWTNNNQTMLIDRGTTGTVIVNDGSSISINCATNLANGTYTNHGTVSCTLTVSNGTISESIPANSIIILYMMIPLLPMLLTAGYKVDYDSSKLLPGNRITVFYNGSLASSSSRSVSLHWGTNGWTNITNVVMTKGSNGFWQADVTIPASATKLDFDFTNGTSWDNNGNQDWHLQIWPLSVPPLSIAQNLQLTKTSHSVL